MINIGVIGFGYWGPNLVRNFSERDDCRVVAVCDQRTSRLDACRRRYPGVALCRDQEEFYASGHMDAVVIATPVSSHFSLAMEAFKRGKHVLVEKPLAFTAEQGLRMVREAQERGLVLMVDHTFIYTGAVRKIHELVTSGELGHIFYYDSTRVNLGLFQHDVNVLWDLAVHDLSILHHVIGARPAAVSATGSSHVAGRPEDTGYLTIYFEDNLIAHINVNWLAPVKIRSTLIGGSNKMVVYDDLEPSEKLKVFDRGIEVNNDPEQIYQLLIEYRMGDMWAPKLDTTEALAREAEHFLECISQGSEPQTSGQDGLRIVQILEAANQSLAQRGVPVEVKL